MLDSFLAWLQQVCEVCHTEGVEIGILGRYVALLPTGRARAPPRDTVALLEAVDAAVGSPTVVHGRSKGK